MARATPPDTGAGTVTSADGTDIAYERTGSGPPLVLVHGNADVHEFWDLGGSRQAFAEHHTVYAMDRRGRGESPPFYSDAVEAVAAALPNSRIVTFDGQSHEPMNTAPDRFADEVLAFVRGTD